MILIEITAASHGVTLDLAYATANDFTGAPIYRKPVYYLNPDAATLLARAAELASAVNLRLKISDAYRPTEAQLRMWNCTPNSEFLSDPRRDSPHSRGAAVDLTLVDTRSP